MIAVITGDIINSQHADTEVWITRLKNLLENWGSSPLAWEIYRGDEFQLKCKIDDVFWHFLAIKSLIKSQENLDVRIAIGIGEENFSSEKITESNGTAYVNSGRLLNDLKNDGHTVAIKTTNDTVDRDLNILLKWSSKDFDNWTMATAEIIHEMIMKKDITQEDLAKKFAISQSSVSQRLKRANYDLIVETNQYFKKKISEL
ncbi:SatD family protein [Chryseobacterium daecheongense]|uniref:MarR family transcriptional regulator n=1 Tax=Chryseobacterium daecheongense TaxID=192389 RepID=A0A3N0W3U0_9FLAO|nr:SatD family protein [Chryseobacterium daecheongense]ROH99725.1 MarR family transcriptional regulator [Chryseobacterium daecheongense]TDX95356.1 SatD family protein [Chryseobacterium daecheongense]UOU97572.1 SatD family protein [Chryseobacterium daecheongense]